MDKPSARVLQSIAQGSRWRMGKVHHRPVLFWTASVPEFPPAGCGFPRLRFARARFLLEAMGPHGNCPGSPNPASAIIRKSSKSETMRILLDTFPISLFLWMGVTRWSALASSNEVTPGFVWAPQLPLGSGPPEHLWASYQFPAFTFSGISQS